MEKMKSRTLRLTALTILLAGIPTRAVRAEEGAGIVSYAQSCLEAAGNKARVKIAPDLGHLEAFRIREEGATTLVEGGSGAGILYGAQALLAGDYVLGKIDKPDFDIRGTTLPFFDDGKKVNSYTSVLSPAAFPWFFDDAFMTRLLDNFAHARLNTIYVWAGHMFPYLVEMPKYPEAASEVPPEQIKSNQARFLWFTKECERRNIRVLLHFYNIHVSPSFAKAHAIPTNPSAPTPLLREYTHYALSRYFETFPSVGLYACPGESLASKYQLEWFRDVIFDVAKKSGKNPVIIIRDWTLNKGFRSQLRSLYANVYSEAKHNDESFTSPYPDLRHMQWEGMTAGHIINVHGPAMDLQPMRWASPRSIQEAAQAWRKLGFVRGIEFYGTSFWKWPFTGDKFANKEERILSLDREAPYYAAFGRYIWNSDRPEAKERDYWNDFFSKHFDSKEIGERIARWYEVTGPISPGLQNLNATKVANFWATVLLRNQNVDEILTFNKRLDEVPYTLYREAGRAESRFYPRPYDGYFFGLYRKEYGLPKPGANVKMYKEFEPYARRLGNESLAQRHCMPVSQYAECLEKGQEVDNALTPDRVVRLLHKLAGESLDLAQAAEAAAPEGPKKQELHRYVTDSQLYVLATKAMVHKEQAAILKARMLLSKNYGCGKAFIDEMTEALNAYTELSRLTQTTYKWCNDLVPWQHWSIDADFKRDLKAQEDWLKAVQEKPVHKAPQKETR